VTLCDRGGGVKNTETRVTSCLRGPKYSFRITTAAGRRAVGGRRCARLVEVALFLVLLVSTQINDDDDDDGTTERSVAVNTGHELPFIQSSTIYMYSVSEKTSLRFSDAYSQTDGNF